MPWFNASDPSLNYDLRGSGTRSLILCHELGGSLESWDVVAAQLDQDFRILRWDQRGAGLSEKPVEPYPIAAHADDLDKLVAATGLQPPYCLAGVAAGVAVALLFAERRRIEAIAGAVFCAPSLGVDGDRRQYLMDRSAKARQQGMRAIADATLARSFPEESISDSEVFDAYRARFLGNDPVSYGLANGALADFVLGDRLAAIAYPVTLLAGRHDRMRPPEYVETLSRSIPHGRFEIVESGHVMPVQAPRAVAQAIRALQTEPA